jgi:Transglycosylase SLT domain
MLLRHMIALSVFALTGNSTDYAAWSTAKANSKGDWTAITESAVRASTLPSSLPADAAEFCPPYEGLSDDARVIFWVALISKVAELESDFNPHDRYTENFKDKDGHFVISRGLLQLSMEDAQDPDHGCKFSSTEELEDPMININCGVSILNKLIKRDGYITTKGTVELGGARYWSVLRRGQKLQSIVSFTKQIGVCKVPR